MNILPPVPTPTVFNVGTVNTESVRRDNTQREAVPQIAANEKSAAETAVGSEADKVKTPGKSPQPLTYEKPVPQAGQQLDTQNDATQDNGQDASAGKENAEDKQQQLAQQQQLTELKQRDAEVRAHEQAHASLGGQYAHPPQYEYERGPDGKRYAVEGEVSIDISKASTPEETIRKAQQVRAAALAPAEPSAQDLRVATEASKMALEARTEIATERAKEAQEAYNQAIPEVQNGETKQNTVIGEVPSLEDIVDEIDVGIPTRSLDIGQLEAEQKPSDESDFDLEVVNEFLKNRDLDITRRVSVIESFYNQVTSPRAEGLQQSA
ncbi:putative metalloprotease CJM1_0395 family protein [uncultured Paraglaciecola sp.]|uniref:putative metalloprotease CJM1_0395 family protein n=1 Tax=uncultured Paraglaciecola sp. TaxID=1765024 RepID=UPI0030D80DFC|tara:strand:+ start:99143 stop:100111 length:969 start_codon:yes stop_codon:yes gene_type:complete